VLTDLQIRKAKPAEKPFKLTDGGGLHLYVTPAGGKLWRLRYEVGGKEKLLSLGKYPAMSLNDARDRQREAKAALATGRDPGIEKRRARTAAAVDAANTFELIAREWHALQRRNWTERHADDVMRSLERDVFPELGDRALRDITAPEVLQVLRGIEARPAIETARRVRQRMSDVFVFAVASGRGESDPAAVVQKAMAPLIKGRQPAITDLGKARKMLADAEGSPANIITKLANRLLLLTALRPGTVITTPWSELEEAVKAGTWQVPAARMKLRLAHKTDEARDHLVPLSRQALETIAAVREMTGRCPVVFPNMRHAHKPMSENAIGYYLNRAGYHHRHVPHGWRSTFSTVMNERFPADRAVIDLMLAHVPDNKVEGAYNRALHLNRRAELAQLWADLILEGAPAAGDLLSARQRE
jgi:integrase